MRPEPLKSLPEITFSVKHATLLLVELYQHRKRLPTYSCVDQLEPVCWYAFGLDFTIVDPAICVLVSLKRRNHHEQT